MYTTFPYDKIGNVSHLYDEVYSWSLYSVGMAKVLFFVQLIVALVILPFWPGLDPRFTVLGLTFIVVVVALPAAAVVAVYGFRVASQALAHPGPPGRFLLPRLGILGSVVGADPPGGRRAFVSGTSAAFVSPDPGILLPLRPDAPGARSHPGRPRRPHLSGCWRETVHQPGDSEIPRLERVSENGNGKQDRTPPIGGWRYLDR